MESRSRVNSALRLITTLGFEVELFAKLVAGRLRTHPGYQAIHTHRPHIHHRFRSGTRRLVLDQKAGR